MRVFGFGDVKRKFKKLLNDFQPDVVHLHNIHSYLSPIVAKIAHKKGIKVVWTLHDYKLICPTYLCLRDGKVCEACFRDKSMVYRYKCMKNSRMASFLAWKEADFWNAEKLSKYTDTFISPSHFLKSKMIEAGFSPNKIEVLHNFLPASVEYTPAKKDFYCYAGRISREKDVETLLKAAEQLPYHLKIIGDGVLLDSFQRKYKKENIEFLGRLSHQKTLSIIGEAKFFVLPSICYENNPYSIIEALCMGVPVIGANIGGIPELINEGENGFLFPPGDIEALQKIINYCFENYNDTFECEKITGEAQNKFSPDTFYKKLITIYDH
jgi:glycosyltransferase involved in cell wall biosynthesis